jgi:DNA-directed RNA polymerase specialized sigma24 family protein
MTRADPETRTRHVTTLLLAWNAGDRDALDQLVPLVHDELHRRARHAMSRERADHSLQPTALVNEVYLRLVDMRQVQWTDRAHFMALAALDPRRSQVVELRFFAGLDVDEAAEVLKVSRRTVMRDWTLARTWLFRELRKSRSATETTS